MCWRCPATGPSGLVNLPLIRAQPRFAAVTVVENSGPLPVAQSPRVHAELWLDLIVGAVPLENGLLVQRARDRWRWTFS